MNSNPKDPLLKTGPEIEQQLFKTLSGHCHGHKTETILNVACNLLINAVRQQKPTRAEAELMMDELLGRAKAVLLDLHYDSVGRRKGIFPYDQVITVPHLDFRSQNARTLGTT